MRVTTLALLGLSACGPAFPDPVCEGGGWDAVSGPRFVEATAEWGLTGVEGTRLVAADVDGDGRVDLHVHRGSLGARGSFAADGTRRSWLLRNTGSGFEDVTQSSGFRATRDGEADVERSGSVVAFADVDGDGDLDAVTAVNDVDGSTTPDVTEVMLQTAPWTFDFAPDEGAWRAQQDAPAGATFVDVDKDGIVDLWLPRNSLGGVPQQDGLYKGRGDGTFVDVTASVGMETLPWGDFGALNEGRAHTNAWSSRACDLDDDGWPELLAASYGRAPNHLWHANGDGTWANVSVASGYAYDDDQDFRSNQFYRCYCQSNPSAEDCADAPAPEISCQSNWSHDRDREPWRLAGNSAETTCKDIDNDGVVDLMTGEIQHWWAGLGSDEAELLFGEPGGLAFTRPGNETTGLTRELPAAFWDKGDMTNAVFDVDNDGWADVYVGSADYPGTRGHLWRQVAPRRFEAVDPADFFEHRSSHGVVPVDVDDDGDLDLLVGHSRGRCSSGDHCYETSQVRLFLNQTGGNHVQLDLVGAEGANTMAVGAKVRVTAGDVTQTFEVEGGGGHYGGQDPARVHAGLGEACEAEVEVTWPDRDRTVELYRLPAGHRFVWRMGEVPEAAER